MSRGGLSQRAKCTGLKTLTGVDLPRIRSFACLPSALLPFSHDGPQPLVDPIILLMANKHRAISDGTFVYVE